MIIREKYENKPELYMTLEGLRKNEELDRRLSWREVLERIFGRIDTFKTREEKLDEEVEKFVSIYNPESRDLPNIRNYMKAYIADEELRQIIKEKHYQELHTYPGFSMQEFKALGKKWQKLIPEYVLNYVSLNPYMN